MRYDINPYFSCAEGTYRTEGISHTKYISQIRQDLYRGAFAPYLPLATFHLQLAIIPYISPLANGTYMRICRLFSSIPRESHAL